MDTGPRGTRKNDYSPKKCGICGITFERPENQRGAAWTNRVYCSVTCVNEARRRKAWEARPERTCPMCGQKFRTRQPLSRAITCGAGDCKRRYRREIAAPKIAQRMREAYARGERPKVRGISPREQVLWPLLKPHGWQWRHRWFDEWGCFEVDFALYDCKIAVEIDGPEHGHARRGELDAARDAELEHRGWTVVRIANADVDADVDAVAARILDLI